MSFNPVLFAIAGTVASIVMSTLLCVFDKNPMMRFLYWCVCSICILGEWAIYFISEACRCQGGG